LIKNLVVDHTPDLVPSSQPSSNNPSSVAAVFAAQSIDFSKDSDDGEDDDIYHDESEMAFGRVVDKIPSLSYASAITSNTPPAQ
jgi:hypothetical protein